MPILPEPGCIHGRTRPRTPVHHDADPQASDDEEPPVARTHRILPALGLTALAGLSPLLLAAPAVAQEGGASVRVLHGIPGTPVDVYVNGERALDDFAPKTITDDLGLAAGSYEVAVFPADAADASGTPVISATLQVPGSGNVSAIAHLGADGTPTITPFVNDVSEVPAGSGRLVVRHTAAAPAVDVLAGDDPVFRALTNPNEEAAELPVGTVNASVALAGTTDPVIGPADVPVEAATVTAVYAIGSAEDETLDVLVQSLSATGGAPGGVPAGSGGLLDDGGLPLGVLAVAGAGLLLAAGGGARLARARR